MNHTTLQMFKIVAEEQSVTKAAKRLGRVQSNITTRIQQLEEDLGVALFVRDSKKMILSPEGESFLSYTKKILSLAEEARQALHPGKPAGALNMGSMEATAVSRLMPVFQQFHRQYPDVALTLTTQPTQQLLEQVRQASLDCALVSLLPEPGGLVHCPEDLEFANVFLERLVLIAPEAVGHNQPRLAAFPRGCSYRARGEALLNAQTLVEVQDVSSYHSMMASVASGRCSGVLPESVAATLTLPEGTQQQFVAEALTQLVWRKGYHSTALEAMKQILASASNL
ncbi:LysR family transcriptional regulator [Cedecea neteri]|uniref:LysR family transcriptional regulator n=1 Tax=Cedecea neteri TaxID=158822 RepID=UPI0005D78AF0|nr:LysR family transcriptional regulator [Cedecea neteri]AJZ91937.1 LysR family transcriptional regulator [Klebsiella michiganensis]WPU25406.1 LysR family transcriptional regulator [Cedecea neteri]